MIVTLSVVICLHGQCMKKMVLDSRLDPKLTIMGCVANGQTSVARFIVDNYPDAKIVKWQCKYANRARPFNPSL